MGRNVVIAIVTAIVLFRAGTASADARPVSSWAASHDGTVEGDRITWRTLYVGNDAPGTTGELRIDLAAPLHVAAADVSASRLVRVVQSGDVIIGFVFNDAAPWRDGIAVTVVQRFDDRRALALAPPLARGETVQVVTVTGQDDLQFEPSRATALVRHVGFVAPDDIDHAARAQCDELLGRRFPPSAAPIYVRGASRVATDGMAGALTTADERSRPGVIGAAIAFFAIAIALVLGYKRLGGHARAEQAEVVLREEYEAVERAVNMKIPR